jgi:hypothetical protein
MGNKFEWGGRTDISIMYYALRLHRVQNTASTGTSVAREAHGPKATRGDGAMGRGEQGTGDEGSRATATREQGDGDEGRMATATRRAG